MVFFLALCLRCMRKIAVSSVSDRLLLVVQEVNYVILTGVLVSVNFFILEYS